MPKGIDNLASHPDAVEARALRWAHYALSGRTSQAVTTMHAIIDSPTTTPEAKSQAQLLLSHLASLLSLLATRKDPT